MGARQKAAGELLGGDSTCEGLRVAGSARVGKKIL